MGKNKFFNNENLAALVIVLLLSCTQAYYTDKSALYEKYPQLLDTEPCYQGLNQLFINIRTQAPPQIMAQSSMHALDDLGSLSACEFGTIGDLAGYSTLKLNVTHIPISLYMGLCLPKECSQQNQTQFSN